MSFTILWELGLLFVADSKEGDSQKILSVPKFPYLFQFLCNLPFHHHGNFSVKWAGYVVLGTYWPDFLFSSSDKFTFDFENHNLLGKLLLSEVCK